MINTRVIGIEGEQIAYNYFVKEGYKILERNYKSKIGEIDLIAKKDDFIIFIEVKDRSSIKYGYPREAITLYKQNKIRKTALYYLKIKNLMNSKVRFDCLEILSDNITHLENCF